MDLQQRDNARIFAVVEIPRDHTEEQRQREEYWTWPPSGWKTVMTFLGTTGDPTYARKRHTVNGDERS